MNATKEKIKNTNNDVSLIQIIKCAKKNDPISNKAYAELYHRYHNSILFYLKRSIKNKDEAEDFTIEILAKAHENISKFDEENGAFSTWLFTLARNYYIDKFRKRVIDVVSTSDMVSTDTDGHTVEYESEDVSYNRECEMIDDEKRLFVRRMVDCLKPTFIKEVISLRFFEHLTYEEISLKTSKPIGSVKVNIFRGKKMLKDEFLKRGMEL